MRYHLPYFGTDIHSLVLSQTPANTARPRTSASALHGLPV